MQLELDFVQDEVEWGTTASTDARYPLKTLKTSNLFHLCSGMPLFGSQGVTLDNSFALDKQSFVCSGIIG